MSGSSSPPFASADCILRQRHVSFFVENSLLGWVVLDHQRSLNANVVDLEFLQDMTQVLDRVEQLISSKQLRVLVFCSAKKNSFVVGADVKSIYPVLSQQDAEAAAQLGQGVNSRIAALKVPTIAAINGPALGAGCELALACKYRVAAALPKVSIGLPEVKLGLIPGAGGTVRLSKLIGLQAALQIIVPGGAVDAQKAKRQGLVDKVLEAEERYPDEKRFFFNVRQFATTFVDRPVYRRPPLKRGLMQRFLENTWPGRRIMASQVSKNLVKTTKGKYPAPFAALDSVMFGVNSGPNKGCAFEARLFGKLAVTPECKNLMSIFFLTDEAKKRAALTNNAPVLPVRKVAVIGAGVMGSGIAHILAKNNIRVYLRDIKQEFVDNALNKIRGLFEAAVRRRSMSRAAAEEKMALITGGTSLQEFTDADLVIEAAIERMDLKQRILLEVEGVTRDNCIFATNTSALSIAELSSVSKRPGLVVGMHFFNPVHRMPLVEVIRCKATTSEAVATVYQLSLDIGKIPVLAGDGPGFIVNRVLAIYMTEAGRLAAEGTPIHHIDKTLQEFGLPMGPFRLLDTVGLDVAAHVSSFLEQKLGKRFSPIKLIGDVEKAGRLGEKTGKGIYTYHNGKAGKVDPEVLHMLAKVVPRGARAASKADIIDRCVLAMVNEAALLLEEGIASRAEDVDLAMVMGTGFAPFRGGLLQYADTRGIQEISNRLKLLELGCGDRFTPAPLLQDMAVKGTRFFPRRPQIPFQERTVLRPKL